MRAMTHVYNDDFAIKRQNAMDEGDIDDEEGFAARDDGLRVADNGGHRRSNWLDMMYPLAIPRAEFAAARRRDFREVLMTTKCIICD